MNSLTASKDKSLSARLAARTGTDQFLWLVAWCALFLAVVWWIVLPALIGSSGERVRVRVVDTWKTGGYITLYFYETQLVGTRLAITLPDGGTR